MQRNLPRPLPSSAKHKIDRSLLVVNLNKLAYTKSLQDMLLDPKNRISWVRKIEEEKKKQLSTIPTRNRLGFHQIGFGNVDEHFIPVVQLSPFEVNKEVQVEYLNSIKFKVRMPSQNVFVCIFHRFLTVSLRHSPT